MVLAWVQEDVSLHSTLQYRTIAAHINAMVSISSNTPTTMGMLMQMPEMKMGMDRSSMMKMIRRSGMVQPSSQDQLQNSI
jgi:hypothetical protein